MQKGQIQIILIGILIVVMVAGGAYYFSRSTTSKPPPPVSQTSQPVATPFATPVASNFNLIFKYGVGAKNELDTFKEIYTKDLITDAPISTQLILLPEELNRIYQKMKDISFFDYPEKFSALIPSGSTVQIVIPYDSYYFKVQYGSMVKEILWERDDVVSPLDEKTIKLKELISLIKGIIESKEEYGKLPPTKGGYL